MSKLQNNVLQTLVDQQRPVDVYCKNGIRLHAQIKSFDEYGVLLYSEDKNSQMLIYKHIISTIVYGN